MSTLRGRNDRGIADERVVDARVGHKVGLELVEIDVEGTVKSERRCNGADDLGDQTVEMLVRRPRNVQVTAAYVIDSLVIHQEGTVRVLNGAVGRQDGIVGLDNGVRDTRRGVDGELELRLLAILCGEALQEES